jgi:hypothetical protein
MAAATSIRLISGVAVTRSVDMIPATWTSSSRTSTRVDPSASNARREKR